MSRSDSYHWPQQTLSDSWQETSESPQLLQRGEESLEEISKDSRWPAFFPCNICLVTTGKSGQVALEKVVGASIVNRFPYIVALSFCRETLSKRHYARNQFCSLLEDGGTVAIQFLQPGETLDRIMREINSSGDESVRSRLKRLKLKTRLAVTNPAPVFDSAYMVYEAKLVEPRKDFSGNNIFDKPWYDVGSHRTYFLEIQAIQLLERLAKGEHQIHWKSLPSWAPQDEQLGYIASQDTNLSIKGYQKGFSSNYAFPSTNTVAFEWTTRENGMAIKRLPPSPQDQVEIDNDKARWPCFFPSSVGMITSYTESGSPNLMPCGSTTIVSRRPLVVAPCVSYSAINERYAPRASLDSIRKQGKFVCGVPFDDPRILDAIRYCGNTSIKNDPNKLANSSLAILDSAHGPLLPALPINFKCEVMDEVLLGTHSMFFGRVTEIVVRKDVDNTNCLKWQPWAHIKQSS